MQSPPRTSLPIFTYTVLRPRTPTDTLSPHMGIFSRKSDPALIADALRVALYETSPDFMPGPPMIVRHDVPGLVAVLMKTDRKGNGGSVTRDDVAPLGLSDDDLFTRAIANGLKPAAEIDQPSKDIPHLFVVTGTTFQVSAAFLSIKSIPKLFGEHGCLIAYCDKSTFACTPIHDLDELDVGPLVHVYKAVTEMQEPQFELPLFWRGKGEWDIVTVKVSGENVDMELGDKFQAMLDREATR